MSDFKAKMHPKFDFGWGSAPGGAYSAPPDPQLDLRGPLRGREGKGRDEKRDGKGWEGRGKGWEGEEGKGE